MSSMSTAVALAFEMHKGVNVQVAPGAMNRMRMHRGCTVEMKTEFASLTKAAIACEGWPSFHIPAEPALTWLNANFVIPKYVLFQATMTRTDKLDIFDPVGDSFTGALALALAKLWVGFGSKATRTEAARSHLTALESLRLERCAVCAKCDDSGKLLRVGAIEDKLAALTRDVYGQVLVCVVAEEQTDIAPVWFPTDGKRRLRVVHCGDLWQAIGRLFEIQAMSAVLDP